MAATKVTNRQLVTLTKGGLITSTGTANAVLAVGTDGHVLIADSAQANGIKWAESAGRVTGYAVLQHSVSAGTGGGGLTQNTWNTRTLNTEVEDFGSIVSLSSNQFSLSAGTYLIRAWANHYLTNASKIRLRDVGAGVTLAESMTLRAAAADFTSVAPTLCTRISSGSAFAQLEIQSNVSLTNGTNGGGFADTITGVNNVFVQVEITRLSS